MTKKQQNEGELSDQQLDDVAGGGQDVVKMETIQVSAKRERPDAAGTRLAAVDARKK